VNPRRAVVQLVDGHAHMLVAVGRLGFRAFDAAVDWVDDNLGPLLLAFVLDRYCQIVTAGQVA
jgi:hypothetical protein